MTREPSADHACAISTPTTPPPRTKSRAGTSFAVVASTFVHGRASREARDGGTWRSCLPRRRQPCARRAHRPRRATRRSPSSRPWPRTSSTSRSSSHGIIDVSSRSWITSSRRSSTAGDVELADRQTAHPPRLGGQLDRPEQRLRRHAREVRAFPADKPLLDEGHGEAVLAEPPCRDLARRPCPDHNRVERPLRHLRTSVVVAAFSGFVVIQHKLARTRDPRSGDGGRAGRMAASPD